MRISPLTNFKRRRPDRDLFRPSLAGQKQVLASVSYRASNVAKYDGRGTDFATYAARLARSWIARFAFERKSGHSPPVPA